MTQTDAEIVALVARALLDAKQAGAITCGVESWERSRGHADHVPILSINYDELAAAVVAALTEAWRLRGVDRKVRDAIEHLLLFVEQGEHGWTIEGKAATVRAWLDAEPTP